MPLNKKTASLQSLDEELSKKKFIRLYEKKTTSSWTENNRKILYFIAIFLYYLAHDKDEKNSKVGIELLNEKSSVE